MAAHTIDNGVIRVGIVGTGFMGEVHTRAARAAGANVVGIVSRSAETAAQKAALWRTRAYRDLDELLAEGVDLIHVCTPNDTHLMYTRAALAAGAHVVCEKPLATTRADAEDARDAASKAGLLGAVPFVYRYHPMVNEARRRVAAGEIGRVTTAHGTYLQDWLLSANDDNWRVDARTGGQSRAFADIGSHLCDLFEFISGERIASLHARAATTNELRGDRSVFTEDAVALTFSTRSGAIGALLVSQVAPGRKNALVLEVSGSQQSVRFEQERPDELWLGGRDSSRIIARGTAGAPGAEALSIVPAGHPMGYQDAFTAFASDVYAGVRAGALRNETPSFADGARASALIEAVLESARSGNAVDVGDIPAPDQQSQTEAYA